MMEQLQLFMWVIGLLVLIQTAVIGFIGSRLWTHVTECHGVNERVAFIDRDVERMKQDIGTHDTGMRGEIYRTANMCNQHDLRITILEDR